jgi:hypothetical protein
MYLPLGLMVSMEVIKQEKPWKPLTIKINLINDTTNTYRIFPVTIKKFINVIHVSMTRFPRLKDNQRQQIDSAIIALKELENVK